MHRKADNTALRTYSWTYDNQGRVKVFTNPDTTVTYSYDAASQVTLADYAVGTDEGYTYDKSGNRTISGYSTGADNRLTSDAIYNYTYDAEGNRTRRTKISDGSYIDYSYDYRNRLSNINGFSYPSDVFDRRIGKSWDGYSAEHYVYDGEDIVLVFDENNEIVSRYLHGPDMDQPLAEESGGVMKWMLPDEQGSIRDMGDNSGNLVAGSHVIYDSFGNILLGSGTPGRYAYTGREWDLDVGMYYYRARWYDAGIGRFISQDPKGFDAGDVNLYRYVGNSSPNAEDPTGMNATRIQPDFNNTLYGFGWGGPGYEWAGNKLDLNPSPSPKPILTENEIRGIAAQYEWNPPPEDLRSPGNWEQAPPVGAGRKTLQYAREAAQVTTDIVMKPTNEVLRRAEMGWKGQEDKMFQKYEPTLHIPDQWQHDYAADPSADEHMKLGGKVVTVAIGVIPIMSAARAAGLVDAAQMGKITAHPGPYGTVAGELNGTGLQANHLNQNAAYGKVIPKDQGLTVGMRGNAFRDVGSPHYQFHGSMEEFWSPYRNGGTSYGIRPTNAQYGAATEQALIKSGYTPAQAANLAEQAAAQRAAYGLSPSAPVPVIPARLPQAKP